GLHLQRRRAIERAVVGGEEVFGERNPRRHLPELAPEAATHTRLVARDTTGHVLIGPGPVPGSGIVGRHVLISRNQLVLVSPAPTLRPQRWAARRGGASRRPTRRQAGSSPRRASRRAR